MRFGPVDVGMAEGAILAHAVSVGAIRLKKGRRLTVDDIGALYAAGVASVVAARLDSGDLAEDDAAARISVALRHPGVERRLPATGRVNFHAEAAGVFTVDRALVDAINAIDPALTLATLPEFATVSAGQMVATVKVIPFAAAAEKVAEAETLAARAQTMAVHPFKVLRVGLIQTLLPGMKASVLDKTARVTANRLARSGSTISAERRPPHEAACLADAIVTLARDVDLLVVFGASAVSDSEDVIPTAIRKAGGRVERVGMPVDPGNLLVLGFLGTKPVLGAPGCARSPKENGFDWVLDRLTAGLGVTGRDIARLGVGGLLMEIPTRPRPRDLKPEAPNDPPVAIVILAGGSSSRMGGPNKLMARFGDTPLVRRVAERALAASSAGVTAVTGHQPERLRAALTGLPLCFADNPDFASGLAGSLKAGIRAVPESAEGALILLGDMPGVTTQDIDRLIAAFQKAGGASVVRAVHAGKRGNPVILPRTLFPQVMALEGDTGARGVVESGLAEVIDVEIGAAASLDVDTPDAMRIAGGTLDG